ncbi:MAG TPA: RluA family pseudouridine synthase [Candidatus Limosilactobacillus faecipullorum]|nr:RluA family pseudouridine synthase [Candidatus Limosilactobacillus faecipullorum]
MENTWYYHGNEPIKIKRYLQSLGMGHRLFNDIKNGAGVLMVDHREVRPTTKILPNQPLTIKVDPEPVDPTVAVSEGPLNIVYEDDNWLVINKPAGLSSVPGPTEQEDTVLNRVKGYLIQKAAEDQRPHLITRLDRFTSGLMLIAKHRVASSMISHQVQTHRVKKEYLAIVSGHLPAEHGLIDQPIARVKDQISREISPDGQPAKTEYWVEAVKDQYSLVRLRLHSGRTHQIRVHLSWLGNPLVGDHLYGGELDQVEHQALHATRLEFLNPFTEKELSFKVTLPQALQGLWDQLN